MYLIKTIKGDITKVTDVQAIVNAANNSLGLSTLFQTNFFRLFFRYCTGV